LKGILGKREEKVIKRKKREKLEGRQKRAKRVSGIPVPKGYRGNVENQVKNEKKVRKTGKNRLLQKKREGRGGGLPTDRV